MCCDIVCKILERIGAIMGIDSYFYELEEKENKDFSEMLLLKYHGVIGGVIGVETRRGM